MVDGQGEDQTASVLPACLRLGSGKSALRIQGNQVLRQSDFSRRSGVADQGLEGCGDANLLGRTVPGLRSGQRARAGLPRHSANHLSGPVRDNGIDPESDHSVKVL